MLLLSASHGTYSKSQLLQGDFASRKEIFIKTGSKIASLKIRGFRPEGQRTNEFGSRFGKHQKVKIWQMKVFTWGTLTQPTAVRVWVRSTLPKKLADSLPLQLSNHQTPIESSRLCKVSASLNLLQLSWKLKSCCCSSKSQKVCFWNSHSHLSIICESNSLDEVKKEKRNELLGYA